MKSNYYYKIKKNKNYQIYCLSHSKSCPYCGYNNKFYISAKRPRICQGCGKLVFYDNRYEFRHRLKAVMTEVS